jgi:hypothetical protein
MIIVKLMGGLGNQMFQYALGRSLSHKLDVEFKMDLSWFSDAPVATTKRNYELAAFCIKASPATSDDLHRLLGAGKSKLMNFMRNLNPFREKTFVQERWFQFDPLILTVQDDVYLEGFWQSEKYFEDVMETLRSEFVLHQSLDDCGCQLESMIDGSESVSIHFRRGDYVTSESAKKLHGTCSLDYYRNAIAMLNTRISDPHFFIFSDDPSWVRNNFSLDFPSTFISQSGSRKACDDMHLMSKCRHHILANSTFSWWGAWLHGGKDNTVVAPKQWFIDGSINTSDLLPERWIRM